MIRASAVALLALGCSGAEEPGCIMDGEYRWRFEPIVAGCESLTFTFPVQSIDMAGENGCGDQGQDLTPSGISYEYSVSCRPQDPAIALCTGIASYSTGCAYSVDVRRQEETP